jgi:flavin reductase (DIM6/NTAB) family NADH-FMN oxidoreductase RutF
MLIKPSDIDPRDFYKILISTVMPRPIAWVSTISMNGVHNLAPFSFFTVASAKPPVLCFAPAFARDLETPDSKRGRPKDTLVNIRATKEFVVNIVSRSLAEKMNQTSAEYPPEISEFEAAGLTPINSLLVRPPCVGESLVNMECRLYQLIEIGTEPMGGTLVLGEILGINLDESVYKEGQIDMEILDPIGRLGGSYYSTIKDRFEIKRPKLEALT